MLNDAKHVWDSADARLGNLETVCTSRAKPAGRIGGSLHAEPEAIEFLRSSAVTAATLANNHSRDYGSGALSETRARLGQRVLTFAVSPHHQNAATEPAIFGVRGIRVAISDIATTTGGLKRVRRSVSGQLAGRGNHLLDRKRPPKYMY